MGLKQEDNSIFDGAQLFHAMETLSKNVKKHFPNLNLVGSLEEHFETLNAYNSFPSQIREKIYSDFTIYSDIVTSAIDSVGAGDLSGCKHLWAVFKKLNLNFDDEIFENLEDDDIVEIYRNDGIQIFRNFNFHNISSYRYPELFTYRWDQLYKRDDFFTKQIMTAVGKIFSGEVTSKMDLGFIRLHKMEETNSPLNYSMQMKQRFFYPLKNKDGEPQYVLAASKVQVLDKGLASFEATP